MSESKFCYISNHLTKLNTFFVVSSRVRTRAGWCATFAVSGGRRSTAWRTTSGSCTRSSRQKQTSSARWVGLHLNKSNQEMRHPCPGIFKVVILSGTVPYSPTSSVLICSFYCSTARRCSRTPRRSGATRASSTSPRNTSAPSASAPAIPHSGTVHSSSLRTW